MRKVMLLFVSVKDGNSAYPTITQAEIVGAGVDHDALGIPCLASHFPASDQVAPTDQQWDVWVNGAKRAGSQASDGARAAHH
jgi:hypothetical protein